MGFIKDIVSGITGSNAEKRAANAQQAAADQAAATQKEAESRAQEEQRAAAAKAEENQRAAQTAALEANRKAVEQARADLAPYNAAGQSAIPQLQSGLSGLDNLITNPQAQKDYITNNPFFDALAGQAKSELFNNNAARGKVGSGGTAEALQNSLLLLGTNLINNNVTQRANLNNQYQGLVNTGLGAAGGQASASNAGAGRDVSTITGTGNNLSTIDTNLGNNLSNLITGIAGRVGEYRTQAGDAQAAGIIGAQNARQAALDSTDKRFTQGFASGGGAGALTSLALCDMRAKENIESVGRLYNGLPVYKFNYKGNDKIHINVMAQDVEKFNPAAVHEINGLKFVDMGAICQ